MPRRIAQWTAVLGLFAASCDLWSAYRSAAPANCVLNPGLCSAQEICSPETERCQPRDSQMSGLRLDSISPPTGPNAGEIVVSLLGSGLSEVQQVTFDGREAPILGSDGKTLQVQLPPHPGKTGYVPVIVRSGDNRAQRDDLFSYHSGSLSFGAGITGTATIPLQGIPQSIDVADLNGDGRLDVVVGYEVGGSVDLVLNEGSRTLRRAAGLMFDSGPTLVAAADLNGDGVTDIAVAAATNAGRMGVTLGRGGGQFDPFLSNAFPTHMIASALTLADFDGDSQRELLLAFRGSSHVAVFPGNLSRIQASSDSLGQDQPRGLAVADLNGDGCLDLAVANAGAASLSVLRCEAATKTLGPAQSLSLAEAPLAIVAGRLNRDSTPDLAVSLPSGKLVVLTNNGSGVLTAQTDTAVGSQPVALAAGDVDGDGFLDLVSANRGDGMAEAASLTILLSSNPAYFQTDIRHPLAGQPRALRIADVDGDGKNDLILSQQEGTGASLLLLFNTTR
jgi:hypothetical protein